MAASGAGGVEAVYDTKHYNLSALIAGGGEVDSERAVQLRKWATRVVEELTLQGFATSASPATSRRASRARRAA